MERDLDDEFSRLMASSGLSGEDLAELGGLDDAAGPADRAGADRAGAGRVGDDAAGAGGGLDALTGRVGDDVAADALLDEPSIPDFLPAEGLDAPAGVAPAARLAVGVIMTPFAKGTPLQMMLGLEGVEMAVVETSTGAIAAVELEVVGSDDWDVAELLGTGNMPGSSPVLEKAATLLAALSRDGVIALVSELATDVGIDAGISGHISARRYVKGEESQEIPAGLVLAQADPLVEDLLLGVKRVAEVAASDSATRFRRWGFKGGRRGPKST
ncbi:hypothetical protein [Buchananella felis]|uniref:hypothetical protein n=1 Tax=Buchananella felis TaxID=3231492 RepID=UPI0035299A9E